MSLLFGGVCELVLSSSVVAFGDAPVGPEVLDGFDVGTFEGGHSLVVNRPDELRLFLKLNPEIRVNVRVSNLGFKYLWVSGRLGGKSKVNKIEPSGSPTLSGGCPGGIDINAPETLIRLDQVRNEKFKRVSFRFFSLATVKMPNFV